VKWSFLLKFVDFPDPVCRGRDCQLKPLYVSRLFRAVAGDGVPDGREDAAAPDKHGRLANALGTVDCTCWTAFSGPEIRVEEPI
jgi:hypothetical protein